MAKKQTDAETSAETIEEAPAEARPEEQANEPEEAGAQAQADVEAAEARAAAERDEAAAAAQAQADEAARVAAEQVMSRAKEEADSYAQKILDDAQYAAARIISQAQEKAMKIIDDAKAMVAEEGRTTDGAQGVGPAPAEGSSTNPAPATDPTIPTQGSPMRDEGQGTIDQENRGGPLPTSVEGTAAPGRVGRESEADGLRRLADFVAQRVKSSPDWADQLEAHLSASDGLVVDRSVDHVVVAKMAGLDGHGATAERAIENWGNAARRKLLALEG